MVCVCIFGEYTLAFLVVCSPSIYLPLCTVPFWLAHSLSLSLRCLIQKDTGRFAGCVLFRVSYMHITNILYTHFDWVLAVEMPQKHMLKILFLNLRAKKNNIRSTWFLLRSYRFGEFYTYLYIYLYFLVRFNVSERLDLWIGIVVHLEKLHGNHIGDMTRVSLS